MGTRCSLTNTRSATYARSGLLVMKTLKRGLQNGNPQEVNQ
ncbi:gene 4.1 [Escherichia phage T7]|uniref:Gene 4.1 n=1 Tax=Escherichia phage T7 TaxID=10760 RepID=Q6WYE5_BPT7|nr:gene 4.1 [Escherichia phage T7]AAP34036.1 gene 4.1 [Escherichia phage T7]